MMGEGRSQLPHRISRLPKRILERASGELPVTEVIVRAGQDTLARGLVALALVAVLTLIMIQLFSHPSVDPHATSEDLQNIRDLGSGLTILMVEEFHRGSRARYNFTLDTSQTVDGLQELADRLHLPYRVRDILENRRLRAFVTTGGALPITLADEIARRYGPYARDIFEISCLLSWISLEGAVIPQYFGEMRDQLQDAYLASYPKVAGRINRLMEQCGLNSTLSETWQGDPNRVMEQCIVLLEQVDRLILDHKREPL